MSRFRSDTGATAVEFAIVLVPLLLLLMGVVDFGRAYDQQLTLSAAAREGVRVMAVQNDPVAARTATRLAAPGLSPALSNAQIVISPASCSIGATATVTVTYPLTSLTGMFDALFSGKSLTGVGVMRCGG
jgi:Flp pilus assembly protein TadG